MLGTTQKLKERSDQRCIDLVTSESSEKFVSAKTPATFGTAKPPHDLCQIPETSLQLSRARERSFPVSYVVTIA